MTVAGAAAPGCATDEPSTPAIAAATQEMIGGTVSWARPEIGELQDSGGGTNCTAVAVTPSVLLTANHCVNGTSAVHPTQFWVFSPPVPPFGPDETAFAFRRVHLFGSVNSATPMPAGDGVGNNDVALVELDPSGPVPPYIFIVPAPIPASLATPAVIAMLPPTGGTTTLYGFGCTERVHRYAPFGKLVRSFPYGSATQTFCDANGNGDEEGGDAGGPVLEGSGAQTDAVWGVASVPDGNGNDTFGNASYYKEAILRVIEDWANSPLEVGIDRYGSDYASVATASASACLAACEHDTACRSFTFTSDGTCHLKNAVPEWYPCPTCTSGVARRTEPASDRSGAPYATINIGSNNPELCLSACAQDVVCNSYSFDATTFLCQKKTINAAHVFVPNSNRSSGTVRGIEADIERPGWTYSTRAGLATQRVCANACAADISCRAFTFWPSGTRADTTNTLCELKNEMAAPIPMPRVYSGIRRGLEYNTDRPGQDYYGYDIYPPSPEICQTACAGDPQCKAFTFVPPGVQAVNARCYLKSSVAGAVKTENMVSGIKGAEFF